VAVRDGSGGTEMGGGDLGRHVEAVGRWAETGHAGQSQAAPAMWRVEATGGWVDQAMSMRRQR
jgi:hypothetical protein